MTKTTQTTTKRTKSTSRSSKRGSSKAQRTERPEGAEIKEQKRRKEQPKVQLHPPYLYPSHILESELKALPLAKCPVPVHVITDKEEARKAIAKIRRHEVIGIDTETRPSFTQGVRYEVSLLQIATPTDCYLFRLNHIGFSVALANLLSDEKILKIGLSLSDDVRCLRRLRPFEPGSFVELQKLCFGYGIRELGLQKIYAILFKERMSKASRMSNWEAKELSPAQIHYAALDAWAALRIFLELRQQPNPSPVYFALL